MPFIKVQRLVRNEDGTVKSGSASVMDTVYVKEGKYHSRQVLRENLGKVVDLDESRRRGIFRSPTRGLVRYDADKDEFSEAEEGETIVMKKPSGRHTVFGDAYAFLEVARKSGGLEPLRKAVPDDAAFEGILFLAAKEFSAPRMPMDAFEARSFLSSVLDLGADASLLGSDSARRRFFQQFCPGAPETVSDVASYEGPRVMLGTRGDRAVWCDAVMDPSRWSAPAVTGLAVLSQDYVSPQLFKSYDQDSALTFIAVMPVRKGLPYKEACQKAAKHIGEKDCVYAFGGREYFGVRKKAEVFGKKAYAYVYADLGSGIPLPAFTVLLSNKSLSSDLVMEAFMSAIRLEARVRRAVSFDMSSEELRGSVLRSMAARMVRDGVAEAVKAAGMRPYELAGYAQSLMCSMDGREILVEGPGEKASKAFSAVGVRIPERLDAEAYRKSLLKP